MKVPAKSFGIINNPDEDDDDDFTEYDVEYNENDEGKTENIDFS